MLQVAELEFARVQQQPLESAKCLAVAGYTPKAKEPLELSVEFVF